MPYKVSSVKLNQLVRLSQRKEALLAQIQNIDRQMVQLEQEFRLARRRKNRKGELTVSGGKKGSRFRSAGRKGGS